MAPDAPLAADGVIELAFDRMLLPRTVNRQAFVLRTSVGVPLLPSVRYDPVRRLVRLGNPDPGTGAWLVVDQSYRLRLSVATDNAEGYGVRAIDGAPLSRTTKREFAFLVTAPTKAAPSAPPSFCDAVLPLLRGRCAGAACHGTGGDLAKELPAAGLVLASAAGLERTAIGRVATLANDGPLPRPRPPVTPFGLDMPLVDPGDPGNSWLVYKALIARGSGAQALRASSSTIAASLSDAERSRLAEHVRGEPMPRTGSPLGEDELTGLTAWIEGGAITAVCP